MTLKSLKLAVAAALTGTAGFVAGAVVLVAPTGCGSDCDVPYCPSALASIQTETNVDVPITNIERAGPSCPQIRPLCRGDDQTTICTHTEFYGTGPGFCEVRITFADRPAEIVEFTFGEKMSCCPGMPIVGESTYYIPVNPDAAIYSAHDAGNDAVRIVVPADPDAGDAGAVTDADVTDGGGTD
jgi:hypothetical protein